MKTHHPGFTLVEMLFVVFIIGVLTTAAALAYQQHAENVRRHTTRMTIKTLRGAIELYDMSVGKFPSSLEDLVFEGDEDWPGPFLDDEEVPNDAWGNAFQLEKRGKRYRVTSPGSDGILGTDDDIWK